jgi:hypothetical protein
MDFRAPHFVNCFCNTVADTTSRGVMKKFLILAGGWFLTIVGGILTPIPLPLPFPLGIMMFLVGCAILTTHSKPFRRGVQYVRHHNGWLSRGLEKLIHRAPERVKTMEVVTRPVAMGRKARMQARRVDG